MKFTERAQWFSPTLVRMLAREKHGRLLTDDQISTRSGLAPGFVYVIGRFQVWDGLDLRQIVAFTTACNCSFENIEHMRRVDSYLRKDPSFQYLRKHHDWDGCYKEMLIRWRKHHGIVKPDAPIWPPLRRLLIRLNPLLKQ